MATLDTSEKYMIYNAYAGPTKKLASASNSNKLELDTGAASTRQQWYLTTTVAPYYRLRTVANGDGQSLDVINDNGVNSTNVQFATSGTWSGQYWRLDPWGDGTYKLSNSFTGLDLHLDVYRDILTPYLARNETTGQHWTITRFNGTISSSTSSAGASQTTDGGSVTPSSSASRGSGGDLPIGTIVGIVIGGLVGLLVFAAAIFLVCRDRRRRSKMDMNSYDYVQYQQTYFAKQMLYPPSELPGSTPGHTPVTAISELDSR